MKVGDAFIRHTTYCFQVLEGIRQDEFNEHGLWPTPEPAVVDEPSQEFLLGQFQRWKDLVKKYSQVSQTMDLREMFIIALAVQRFPGPVLEIGTHKGITTCLMSEVMNLLNRQDHLYTVELFKSDYVGIAGDEYPGESYLKALVQFRQQPPLQRVVPIIGNSHDLKPMFFGLRPIVIFIDGNATYESVQEDLLMLRFFNHKHVCLIHNANHKGVMKAVRELHAYGQHHFCNFHTGEKNQNGMVALSKN
ncbi:MAG: class I SAM-dependent methyltransferase [Candidatus Sumerlaeia bacterium]|nr:class I SAM-dependent methyltransferase [Candidatus Sumerlaeia bacterium]